MSSPTDREAYRAWKERTFGTEYEIWHDGLSTSAVTGLRGPARDRALEMLRFGLSTGDAHAASALAAMGDADSLDAVRAQIERKDGSEKVRAALAAHSIVPDPSLAVHLVSVLTRSPSWSERIDAAMGLRAFAGRHDEDALLDAVSGDADYLVRYHASESLLVRWRVHPRAIAEHPEIFERIVADSGGPTTANDRERFRDARRLLEGLRPERPA